jgi:hypothetical protein
MDVHVRVDLDDDGPVVVKCASGPAGNQRLEDERARLLRAAHPGVVALADADDGGATELRVRYGGEPVARWSGSVDAVAGLGAAVAETLADLHHVGVVHGRIDASHIVLGDDGRPRLCGLSDPGPAHPADDVAALGEVLRALLSRTPAGRRPRRGRNRSDRRALDRVIDAARDPTPTRRPTARALADAIVRAVPTADLPAGPARPTHREPDTLDRIWAVAGDESEDERWAAALGTGPRDLPLATDTGSHPAADDASSALPLADLVTPAWTTSLSAASGRQGDTRDDDAARLARDPVGRDPRLGADTAEHPPATSGGTNDDSPSSREPDDDRRMAAHDPASDGHRIATQGPAGDDLPADHGGAKSGESRPRWPGAEAPDLTRERRPAAGRVAPSRAGTAEPPGSGRGRRWLAVAVCSIGAAVATAAAAHVIGAGRDADAARPDPGPGACAAIDGPAADVDGDGCAEALVVDGATVDAGVAQWSLGEPGDVAAVGDWDCDGEASAALLRPATGDVFLFADWAEVDQPVTVRATRRIAGGIAIRTEPGSDGCDRLLVELRDGGSARVEVAG